MLVIGRRLACEPKNQKEEFPMKNFRKVLALVLAIATLFSFAAIAGASFADMDEDAIPEYGGDYEIGDLITW